jgi:DNA-binding NtrC family response regulator
LGEGEACLIVGLPVGSSLPRDLVAGGLKIEVAASESEALAALDRRPFVAVIMFQRPSAPPLASILARAAQKNPEIPVMVLGATPALQDAVDVMQLGAADYLGPPFQVEMVAARLRKLVDKTLGQNQTHDSVPATLEHLGVVGTSTAMSKVYATIDKISRYKANVLLLGESGSGKELIARALHARGPRRRHLFVPINCATLGARSP